MKRIITYLWCIFICFISTACAQKKSEIYRQCKEQVEAINKMCLHKAYIVPVDSLGQYMNDEVISDDMYDHCEVVANIIPHQVHTFAILYFDTTGKLPKSIEWWSDGGDLRTLSYYDEQGNLIYSVYNFYDNNCGRLYITGSKKYIEHPFSQADNSQGNHRLAILPTLKTTEFASQYKAHLQMPDSCSTESFVPIRKGNKAYLCTNRIYTTPQKDITKSEEIQWGQFILIDSVVNGWCGVRIPTHETLIGYVPIDSIELGESSNTFSKSSFIK